MEAGTPNDIFGQAGKKPLSVENQQFVGWDLSLLVNLKSVENIVLRQEKHHMLLFKLSYDSTSQLDSPRKV